MKRLSLWLKLPVLVYLFIHMPYFWFVHGPSSSLYFCEAALLSTCIAAWMDSSLIASAVLVGALLPMLVWSADFAGELAGFRITGLTSYLFAPTTGVCERWLSAFHVWLPWLLIWIVSRLGFDRRSFAICAAGTSALLIVCYLLPDDSANINLVKVPCDRLEVFIHPTVYLAALLSTVTLMVFLPTYVFLRVLFDKNAHPSRPNRCD